MNISQGRLATLAAVVIVAVDQATKTTASLLRNEWGPVRPLHNPAFSLGVAHAPASTTVFLTAVATVLFCGATVVAARRGHISYWVPALLAAGATSNLVDRLLLGSVRDFLVVPHLIVFNLADVAIAAGLIGLAATIRASDLSAAAHNT